MEKLLELSVTEKYTEYHRVAQTLQNIPVKEGKGIFIVGNKTIGTACEYYISIALT